MAASADRSTPSRHPEAARLLVSYPVATATTIYKGTLVMLVAGYAVPAADTAGGIVVGIAEEQVVNAGADGAARILVSSGNAFRLVGSAIVAADVGKPAYVSDDFTVSDAPGTNGVVAGVIEELEAANVVWIYIPPTNALVPTGIENQATAPVAVMQHAVSAGDITATVYDFVFPFAVAAWSVTFRSATGLALAATNLVTKTGATVSVALDAAGAPKLIATDVVAVVASA